jgi:putative peptidoglycan lipid II flippase
MLPTVSAHVARGEIGEFRKTLGRSLRLAFFLSIPAACGLAVLAQPIIAVVYQHGKFDVASAVQTAWCLRAFTVGLAGYSAIKIIAPTFYAFDDSRTPMSVALFSILVNASTDYLFAIRLDMKTAGLALSTSCVTVTSFLLLLLLMRRRIKRIEASLLLRSLGKILIASAAMSVATYCTHTLLSFNRYLDVSASMIVAIVIFGASCQLLRIEEFGELLAVLRLGKRIHTRLK